ncbi:TusE/DsrC/DsvC family sulfur relay protein [Raineyella fluvialis]|uniref:TusE/DsrC/DsvC family sulfur relay protein n=1 Tax=Raineyella fluvialis TaxID=2662261 RepID=A0A5Q2FAF3_9ACTN|nr:TusE/DsrC/DsvC family sulfur relay protein [Raineyella fluvialis]QGF23351.1 TusE/DsrC/DsvC family sulfur relay protein [Raineyella fluvialis]
MPTNTLNERTFHVNDEGFFTNRDEWSEELGADLAALIDIEMDEEHWGPIRFMREDSAKSGVTPTLRRLQTVGGFDIKELYRLYPGKPAKKMAWIAGLPKPVGCV